MKTSLFHWTRILTAQMLLGVIVTGCGATIDHQVIPGAVAADAPGMTSRSSEGARLFEQWHCSDCHQSDGKGPAPSLVGIAGSSISLANGETVIVDADYVRTSILEPTTQLHAGYPPIMPTLAEQIGEEGVAALVDYILSLQ